MLWLQKTPNGETGFRHTWGVKWSPSPGRIGQMVAVRLIMIACKMEALLLSSLTKRLSFPAMLFFFSPSFIDLSTLAASDESKNALCYLKLKAECVLFRRQSGKVLWWWHATLSIWHVKTGEEFVLSSEALDSEDMNWSKAAHISWQLSWSLSPQSLAKSRRGTLLIGNSSPPFLPTCPSWTRSSWKSKMDASILVVSTVNYSSQRRDKLGDSLTRTQHHRLQV